MRLPLIILLTLTLNHGTSQRLNVKYTTAIDSGQRSHYIIFTDKSNCKLIFPITNHGDAMANGMSMYKRKRQFDLTYKFKGDTLVFSGTESDTSNLVCLRFLNSRCTVKSKKIIHDHVSGYP